MTPEELNQRIEFIVETLARLAVGQEQDRENLERVAAAQERDRERLEGLAVVQERDRENLERLTAALERDRENLERLAAAQERDRENLERLAAIQGRDHEILARLAAAQEQDRRNQLEFQVWSKDLTVRVIDMLDRQSQRLDRQDKFYRDSLQQSHEFQTRTEAFQKQALHLLNLVLDRLPPATAV